jgi:hypothetical protein
MPQEGRREGTQQILWRLELVDSCVAFLVATTCGMMGFDQKVPQSDHKCRTRPCSSSRAHNAISAGQWLRHRIDGDGFDSELRIPRQPLGHDLGVVGDAPVLKYVPRLSSPEVPTWRASVDRCGPGAARVLRRSVDHLSRRRRLAEPPVVLPMALATPARIHAMKGSHE